MDQGQIELLFSDNKMNSSLSFFTLFMERCENSKYITKSYGMFSSCLLRLCFF